MARDFLNQYRHRFWLILSTLGAAGMLGCWALIGCEATSPGSMDGSGSLFQPPQPRWTIRCFESRAPNHQQICRQLAEALASTGGLDRSRVRLESGREGSVIYYGTYTKQASRDGQWLFDDRFQRDIETIRRVTVQQATPFLYAVPELVDKEQPAGETRWSIEQASGPYTLQIATFYDTPTFTGRINAANQYVGMLRDEGFEAYVYHGDLESVVFVGNFNDNDIVQTEEGPQVGPRVRRLIDRKPEEFQYITENGHRRRVMGPTGTMELITSFLVQVPDKAALQRGLRD